MYKAYSLKKLIIDFINEFIYNDFIEFLKNENKNTDKVIIITKKLDEKIKQKYNDFDEKLIKEKYKKYAKERLEKYRLEFGIIYRKKNKERFKNYNKEYYNQIREKVNKYNEMVTQS